MHTSFFEQGLWIGVTTLALVACGSSSDGGSGTGGTTGSGSSSSTAPEHSGLGRSLTAEALSDVQRTELCEWYADVLLDRQNVEASCTRSSIVLAARDTDVLEEQRTACAENSASCATKPIDRATYLDICPGLFGAGCTATVGEIEGCIADQWSAIRANVAGVPECSAITAEDVAQVQEPLAFGTPNCIAASQKCPAFRGDDEPDEPEPPSVVACNETCDAYNAQCGTSVECNCSTKYLVFHGELCDSIGKEFYDCATAGTFDCTEDNLLLASNECTSTDYAACYSNESVDCVRDESADGLLCKDASLPYGFSCVSTSPQTAGCDHAGGTFYCCPDTP